INLALLSGDYYVKVAPADGGKGIVSNTVYTLSSKVDYFPEDTAGNTAAFAQPVTAKGQVSEWLGFGDKDDYYKFELQASTAVTLDLTGMNSNVNLYLYDSKNKQLAASAKSGNTAESITKTLAAGTYYVKATLAGKENTDYILNFNIDPAAFKTGSLGLTGALTGSADTGSSDPLKKNNGLLAS
ncbi:MAG: PPC domain-containing protein, partial [Victivallaceae bacterium]